jgi:hypothetical protein
MIRHLAVALGAVSVALVLSFLTRPARADFPKPSIYPISWELKFEHGTPKRVVVDVPGSGKTPYWYMTYSVTNNTDKELLFLPIFEMMTTDGQIIRSDKSIPDKVFDTIKNLERNRFLLPAHQVGGELRIGDDQTKESVAIWPEPMPRMGTFSIFVGGLSGESVNLKDDKGEPMKDKDGMQIILRKTKQLEYQVRGDEHYSGADSVSIKSEGWVMR